MFLTRKVLKPLLLRLGIEIHRVRPYGTDMNRDVKKILGRRQAAIIMDVGANAGQTALAYAEEFPAATIHSFEPNPEAFKELSNNVSCCKRVRIYPIAFGPQSGKARMHLTRSSLTGSMLKTSQTAGDFLGPLVSDAGEIEVEVSSLDDFFWRHELSHVDLLKLDVQGFELDVLKGAAGCLRENRISLIMTEVNFVSLYERQAYFQDIYAEVLKSGFQLVGLYHGDYRSGAYLAWCDALFINTSALQTGKKAEVAQWSPP